MFSSIMVPVDGSPFGEQAFSLAAGLARRAGARLQLVHVHSSLESASEEGVLVPIEAMDQWEGEVRRAEVLYLHDAARRLQEQEGVAVQVALVGGRVADALEAHAASSGADLVIMSTHGRGGLARAWLGSVADGLLRRLSVPMLLLKATEDEQPTGERGFTRVLVPLDGSRAAEAVLEPALWLAALTGASMRFLVVEATAGAGVFATVGGTLPGVGQAEAAHTGAEEYLARVQAQALRKGVASESQVVAHASAAGGILEQAFAGECDVIALATHGRGGAARLLLGSVADKVLRASPVPVLVQRIPRMKVLPLAP